jgi:AbrB family transcriptional regulator, transcriptional pleiotropic regulator of transition state genes
MYYWSYINIIGGFMKATGMIRNLDNLGRVVLPIELRYTMDIEIKDPLEFYIDEDKILIKKYIPGCIFCKNAEASKILNGKSICSDCINDIKNI